MTRKTLLAQAAQLPPGTRIPDDLLFAEGFDPTDTYIGELVNSAPSAAVRLSTPSSNEGGLAATVGAVLGNGHAHDCDCMYCRPWTT